MSWAPLPRYVRGMSESDSETTGIDDDQLPEDLQPGEDNPLAEPLEEDVDPDGLDVRAGKHADQDTREGTSDRDDDGASDDDA